MKMRAVCILLSIALSALAIDYRNVVENNGPPVAYFRLDTATGDFFWDIAQGRMGTGTSTGITKGQPGAVQINNWSANFATNGAITVPYSASLNTDSFTVAAWFRTTGGTGERTIVASHDPDNATGGGYKLYLDNSGQIKFAVGASTAWVNTGTTTASANTWYYVAGVYSGTTGTLYINGDASGTLTATIYRKNAAKTFTIGADHTASSTALQSFWTGGLDEVVYYSVALTRADIWFQYQTGINPDFGGASSCECAATNTCLPTTSFVGSGCSDYAPAATCCKTGANIPFSCPSGNACCNGFCCPSGTQCTLCNDGVNRCK